MRFLQLSLWIQIALLLSSSKAYEYEDACVHCAEYILAAAAEKEEVIMGKVRGTEYDYGNLPPFKTLCDSVALLEGVDFNNAFDRFSDERPAAFDR